MKKFLLKIGLIAGVVLSIHFVLAQFADGYTDPYYVKFTGEKSNSLILGGSRASEGLMPSVLDSVWSDRGQRKSIFNFAFTNSDSPYGPVYLNAIDKKIDKTSKDGIFILSVHPWNISSLCSDPNDLDRFRENKLVLNKVSSFTGDVNYDYLVNGYNYGWGNVLLKKTENACFKYLAQNTKMKSGQWSFVHGDGWLEVKSMLTDSIEIDNRMKQKIEAFKKKEINHKYKFSTTRLIYLKRTIDELKKYGKVLSCTYSCS